MKPLIAIATIVGITTYMIWQTLPKGSFYIGNAIMVMLLAIVVHKTYHTFWSFVLMYGAINNLLDELFFEPGTLGINEILLIIAIPTIYYFKHERKRI